MDIFTDAVEILVDPYNTIIHHINDVIMHSYYPCNTSVGLDPEFQTFSNLLNEFKEDTKVALADLAKDISADVRAKDYIVDFIRVHLRVTPLFSNRKTLSTMVAKKPLL